MERQDHFNESKTQSLINNSHKNDEEAVGISSHDSADASNSVNPLEPIAKPISMTTKIVSFLQTIFIMLPLGIVGGILFVIIFVVTILTGIGPLLEWYYSKRDEKALNREALIRENPEELFLLEIPGTVNKASAGKSYKIMVRMTQPCDGKKSENSKNKQEDDNSHQEEVEDQEHVVLPPVIFPGGLASNLMTMSRHQNQLTEKYGFTVVNFDRLGVGLSDPYPPEGTNISASAADVAREMEYVMTHCETLMIQKNQKDESLSSHQSSSPSSTPLQWIQVGGSMGTNVATAVCILFPGRIGGFFNLDGLPHAFLQLQCRKFLQDGPFLMKGIMRKLRWTGWPRLAFTMALKPMLPVILGTENNKNIFTATQIVGVMCRDQFFVATGNEYKTLMSCCDLECAAWGPTANTTGYNDETMRVMASLAPTESVLVNEPKGIMPRTITDERSKSELGTTYILRSSPEFVAIEQKLHEAALKSPDQIDKNKTYCNWPENPPRHPVGDFVGGVDETSVLQPLAIEFQRMVVRVMCARDYTGLERDYTQEARNHAAARTSLHVLMSRNAKSYYYPQLCHLNLWQQVSEIVEITHEISQAMMMMTKSSPSRSNSVTAPR